MKWNKFRAAYVNGAWISPYYIKLDSHGMILDTKEAIEGKADVEHEAYLLPGIPNAHSHSFQYVMSGLAERVVAGRENDDFWFWREQMYRLANSIRPEELLHVTTRLYMSMLEQGYTSVAEFHYLNHDFEGKSFPQPVRNAEVIMQAAADAGIALTLIPVYYHQAAPNVPIKPLQRRFYFESVERYASFIDEAVSLQKKEFPHAKIGFGVHSLRAAPLEAIRDILKAKLSDGPCHLHASEQTQDVSSFVEAYGQKPIHWLENQVGLTSQHNLVHATHLEVSERQYLAKSGATVVLCPTTEANLGDGIFPFREYVEEKGSWSIGSDSQVNLNPFIEMTALELTQRLVDKKRNVLCRGNTLDSGKILFDNALIGGRKSMGLGENDFVPGRLFDGVLIDPEHERIWQKPLDSILSILCYAPEKSHILGTFSLGKLRAQNGKHLNSEAINPRYRQDVKRLMSELSGL